MVLQIDVECAKCWSRVQFILTKFLKHMLSKCQGKTSLDHDDFELSRLEGWRCWRWVGGSGGMCFMLHLGWNPPSQTPEITFNRFRFQPFVCWECIWCLRFKPTHLLEHINHQRKPFEYNPFSGKRFQKLLSSLLGGRCMALQLQGCFVTCLGTWFSSSQQT